MYQLLVPGWYQLVPGWYQEGWYQLDYGVANVKKGELEGRSPSKLARGVWGAQPPSQGGGSGGRGEAPWGPGGRQGWVHMARIGGAVGPDQGAQTNSSRSKASGPQLISRPHINSYRMSHNV